MTLRQYVFYPLIIWDAYNYKILCVKPVHQTQHVIVLTLQCTLVGSTAQLTCFLYIISVGEDGAILYWDLLLRGRNQTGGAWFCFP